MVKIRLARGGAKKAPYYRIVVADVRARRDGRLIARLGASPPLVQETRFSIDAERANYWLSVGAKPTDRVRKLMKLASIEGV